jgi:hypothetical protein
VVGEGKRALEDRKPYGEKKLEYNSTDMHCKNEYEERR